MFGFIGNMGPWEIAIILLVALIVVGPGKLPEVAKSLGKGLTEFRRATSGVKKEFEDAMKFEDTPVSTTPSLSKDVELIVKEPAEENTSSED